MYLTVEDVRRISLGYFGISRERLSLENADKQVKKHLGSFALDLAEIWHDICHSEEDHPIPSKEKTMKGFKRFIMAHYWLWTYPKNSYTFASRFKVGEGYCRGEPLHRWIRRIAALKSKKIQWDPEIDNPNGPAFAMTVDGTDFRQEEKKHETMNMDVKECSVKFKHCGCKFEIAISVFKSKVVWVNGPYRGGKGDGDIFRANLVHRIPDGKFVIADRGYNCKEAAYQAKLALPSATDSQELANFKARARCRHETFNSRLKAFACLSGAYFRHGGGGDKGREFMGMVVEAVCVIAQYQMDNGDCLLFS
jgi:hypothetical protein